MDDEKPLILRYTPTARSDIAKILDYLGDQSPRARTRVEAEFQSVFEMLGRFPLAGVATTRVRLRRHVVVTHPYVVFYRATSSTLVIVAVRHTARRQRLP